MVCVHTYSESDNPLLRYGRLSFPTAAILNLIQPEMAPFDPPSPKTPPWNQTRRRSDDASLRYGPLKFSKMAFGHHLKLDPTGNSAVRSDVPENPT